MSKGKNKAVYETPRSVNLSEFTASGDNLGSTMGVCKSGVSPYYNCTAGTEYRGECAAGGTPDTSECVGGGYHLTPACDPGSSAATICISGNGQT